MTKRDLLLGATGAVLLGLSAASAEADFFTPTSESMTDPKLTYAENEQAAALGRFDSIEVSIKGEEYSIVKPTHLALPFHVEAEVNKIRWRIKESYLTIGRAPIWSGEYVNSCCGSMSDFNKFNYAATVPHGDTKHLDKDAWWTIDIDNNHTIATRARNACRNLYAELQDQGMGRDQIFSKDRHTTLPTDFHLAARVAYHNPNYDLNEPGARSIYWKQTSDPFYVDFKVTCLKEGTSRIVDDPTPPPPKPASDDLSIGFQVKQAALAITPDDYKGKCPVKLHLNPTIETNGKGTVRYRFRDQLGHKTKEYQVKFDKADIKFLDHIVEIDAKDKPKGPSLATPQAQGGELGLAAPSDPNLVQGYYQLEIVKPYKKMSKIADYSVKCTNKTAGDGLVLVPGAVPPTAIDGVVVKPKLADLVIEEVQPSPAVPTKLFVKVTNKGTAASTPTNLKALRWLGNHATTRGTLVPAVEPGQSQVVLAEVGGPIASATQLYVRVDDPNRIKEQDEGNNSFKVK